MEESFFKEQRLDGEAWAGDSFPASEAPAAAFL